MNIDISDIVNTLENAENYISDAVADLENIHDELSEAQEQRDTFASIIRALLGDDAELFDEDDPEGMLRLIRENDKIHPSNMLIAFAYGYKAAVDQRDYFFYVRKLREAIAQQERESAEQNQDPSNPS